MTGPLVFEVPGHPAPQGSKTGVRTNSGRVAFREANKRTKPWKTTVAWSLRSQLPPGHQPIDGPVLLVALFTMPAPTKPSSGRAWPSKVIEGSGDEDKLTRAVCDALTAAKVWKDDSRVVRTISGTDFPGAPGFRSEPGCRLIVAPIENDYLADIVTVWIDEVLSTPNQGVLL